MRLLEFGSGYSRQVISVTGFHQIHHRDTEAREDIKEFNLGH